LSDRATIQFMNPSIDACAAPSAYKSLNLAIHLSIYLCRETELSVGAFPIQPTTPFRCGTQLELLVGSF